MESTTPTATARRWRHQDGRPPRITVTKVTKGEAASPQLLMGAPQAHGWMGLSGGDVI